jgi:hypothetical protein
LPIIKGLGGNMVRNTLIKKARNSKGYWRLILVHYSSGIAYYVNHFSFNGSLNSYRFKSFSEADQFFNSQTNHKGGSNDKSFVISV